MFPFDVRVVFMNIDRQREECGSTKTHGHPL